MKTYNRAVNTFPAVLRLFALVPLLFVIATPLEAQTAATGKQSDIETYITKAWSTLTRNVLTCEALVDPKMPAGHSVLYFPADVQPDEHSKQVAAKCKVQIAQLPITISKAGEADLSQLKQHGLLYLPNPYVVPGGRFNEMYGWDSYFIQIGLLRDGELELARDMTDNFLYEIAHYGMILNANRTYFLTRSQPPFLTEMILGVYDRTHDRA